MNRLRSVANDRSDRSLSGMGTFVETMLKNRNQIIGLKEFFSQFSYCQLLHIALIGRQLEELYLFPFVGVM